MAVVLADGLGHSIDEPSAEQMREVLEDLDPDDVEHAAAWLSDEAGNTLEWNIDGRLVYDKQSLPPRHMLEVAPDTVIEFWHLLANGAIAELERQAWEPGAYPATPAEEVERRSKERTQQQLADDRAFFESLGAERADVQCRHQHCGRGAVAQSIFCRVHHFEHIRRRPCPFAE
jgi:hypothetical protein